MKKIFIAFFLMQAGFGFSQNDPSNILAFRSINQFGLQSGASGLGLQVHSVNGVKLKSYFAGLGVGIDNYVERTFPVYLDVRKSFLKGENMVLYADGGVSIPAAKAEEFGKFDYKQGGYYEAGVGYNVKLNKTFTMLFSAGYSIKQFSYKEYPIYLMYISIWPTPNTSAQELDYTLRRISVKVGLSF